MPLHGFIFDNGIAGDGSANSTYYFDDVKQVNHQLCHLLIILFFET
jgi:hypothetical protein